MTGDFGGASGRAPSFHPQATCLFSWPPLARSGPEQLYVRRLTELQAVPVAGTEGAMAPFFRPDGQWVAFFANGKLKKVAIAGGPPVMVCDAEQVVVVGGARMAPSCSRLIKCRTPFYTACRTPAACHSRSERWPKTKCSAVATGAAGRSGGALQCQRAYDEYDWNLGRVMARTLDGGEAKVIVRGGFYGRYVRSGHVLYIHGGTLFAIPFDVARLQTSGEAMPVALQGGCHHNKRQRRLLGI